MKLLSLLVAFSFCYLYIKNKKTQPIDMEESSFSKKFMDFCHDLFGGHSSSAVDAFLNELVLKHQEDFEEKFRTLNIAYAGGELSQELAAEFEKLIMTRKTMNAQNVDVFTYAQNSAALCDAAQKLLVQHKEDCIETCEREIKHLKQEIAKLSSIPKDRVIEEKCPELVRALQDTLGFNTPEPYFSSVDEEYAALKHTLKNVELGLKAAGLTVSREFSEHAENFMPVSDSRAQSPIVILPAFMREDKLVLQGQVLLPKKEESCETSLASATEQQAGNVPEGEITHDAPVPVPNSAENIEATAADATEKETKSVYDITQE